MKRVFKSVNDSLQLRLETGLLWPLLLLFFVSGGVSWGITRYYAGHVYDRWLYDSVNSLAQAVRLTGGRVALDLPRVAQEIFQWDDEDQTLFRVVGSKSGHIAGVTDAPAQARSGQRFRNAWLFDSALHGHDMRWAAVQLELEPLGEQVTVLVGETTRKRRKLAEEILLAVWVPQFLLLLLVAWAMHRVIYFQTHKLHDLSAALRDLSHRDLRPVPAGDMPKELHPLIEALNSVIAKLDHAALAQRSFIANAAHQLRTPLTALTLQAEQAAHCDSLPAMRESVGLLQHAAQRTVRLANQLLLLSRAEPDAQTASNRARVDLRELAFETASAWVPTAISKHLDLGFDETSDSVPVVVDAALVGEAINNLLDNALKYCASGARITVAVRRLPEPCVVVEDSGPGIEPAQRERVVQRFHRGDNVNAEGSDVNAAGSGLGLAIVREIAMAHAGRLVISQSGLGGLRCEIFLPAAATARN